MLQNKERARQNAEYHCERLGKYRMPFAWTAVYLNNVVCGPQTQDAQQPTTPSGKLLQVHYSNANALY